MPKFRKKPLEIEAVKITCRMTCETLEGVMTGQPGDWLITGVKGEQYFCKPDIFEATYEEVKPDTRLIFESGGVAFPGKYEHPTYGAIICGDRK